MAGRTAPTLPQGLYAGLIAPVAANGNNGPGILEILILAGLVVLVVRLFQSRNRERGEDDDRSDSWTDRPDRDDRPQPPSKPDTTAPRHFETSDDPWDRLRSKPKPPPKPAQPPIDLPGPDEPGQPAAQDLSGQPSPPGQPARPAAEPRPRPAENEAEFLRGAKMAYSRIATSLAAGDFDDLAQFCGPRALDQLKTMPRQNVDIMLVSASLAEHNETGGRVTATVDYQSLERRGDEAEPRNRHATWIFGKPAGDANATWVLDEIKQ